MSLETGLKLAPYGLLAWEEDSLKLNDSLFARFVGATFASVLDPFTLNLYDAFAMQQYEGDRSQQASQAIASTSDRNGNAVRPAIATASAALRRACIPASCLFFFFFEN